MGLVSLWLSSHVCLGIDENHCGEIAPTNSYSLALRSHQPGSLCPASLEKHKSYYFADFYLLTISEWRTKTNIFDGLLARFISTKNQTHHNFFLMAQLISEQGLQIHQACSSHSFRRLKCQPFSSLGTLSGSPGA
jgi:hypothetical protein